MSDFTGFEPANTTPVPDTLFDQLLAKLTGAELKVLLYIIRRTRGFKKETDAISFNQFLTGITTREGKVLDYGCGLKDRTTLSKTLAALEGKGYITSTKGDDPNGDKATTIYGICFKGEVVGKSYHPTNLGSREIIPPVVGSAYHRSMENLPGVVGNPYLQETVIQQTDLQETVEQEGTDTSVPTPRATLVDLQEKTSELIRATDGRIKAIRPEPDVDATQKRPAITMGGNNGNVAPVTQPSEPPVRGVIPGGAPPPAAGALPIASSEPRAPGAKRGKKDVVTQVESPIPQEAVAIMDDWDSLFKTPVARTDRHIEAAVKLIPCRPSKQNLKDCRAWLFTTDNPHKPWFRKKGVKLLDVTENYGAWQSVQPTPDEEKSLDDLEPYSFAWILKQQEQQVASA